MLEDVKAKIEKLVAAYETAMAHKKALAEELEKARALNDDYRKQIEELEKKIDNLRLSGALSHSAEDRAEARKRIDRMIREIDKCISLMEG